MSRPDRVDVLSVDDDATVASLVQQYLEREDERIAVTTATSAVEGLAILDRGEFDCIVSDFEMPEMNGLEFLREVRQAHNGLPFIMFTGRGNERVASEAMSAGVTDYLQKNDGPEPFAVLAASVREAVSRSP
jgi:DNA-binding NtrC family response regulator